MGRFHSIDPKAETYSLQTPYSYATNRPIRFQDINGEGILDNKKAIVKNEFDQFANAMEKKTKEIGKVAFVISKFFINVLIDIATGKIIQPLLPVGVPGAIEQPYNSMEGVYAQKSETEEINSSNSDQSDNRNEPSDKTSATENSKTGGSSDQKNNIDQSESNTNSESDISDNQDQTKSQSN